MGSEMCIRDRSIRYAFTAERGEKSEPTNFFEIPLANICILAVAREFDFSAFKIQSLIYFYLCSSSRGRNSRCKRSFVCLVQTPLARQTLEACI